MELCAGGVPGHGHHGALHGGAYRTPSGQNGLCLGRTGCRRAFRFGRWRIRHSWSGRYPVARGGLLAVELLSWALGRAIGREPWSFMGEPQDVTSHSAFSPHAGRAPSTHLASSRRRQVAETRPYHSRRGSCAFSDTTGSRSDGRCTGLQSSGARRQYGHSCSQRERSLFVDAAELPLQETCGHLPCRRYTDGRALG